MGNRAVAWLILLTFIFALPGCWDRREIEELAIINAVGVDIVEFKGQELFRISYIVMRPGVVKGGGSQAGGGGVGGGGAAQHAYFLVSATGKTILDASRNLSARLTRYQFVPPIMVIIIGEKLAQKGAKNYLDFFERHKDFRLRTLVFIVKGEALDTLAAQTEFEASLADEIRGIATNSQPFLSKGDLLDVLRNMTREGKDSLIGRLEVTTPPENEILSDKQKEAVGRPETAIVLSGAAVLKEGKLVGFLTNEEARGFLFVTGKAKLGIIPLVQEHGDKVSILMKYTKSSINSEIKGGKLKFIVNIKVVTELWEHEGNEPVATPDGIKSLEQQIALEVKKLVEHTIDKAQHQFKADIFGFGETVYRKHPKLWREIKPQWREVYYPQAEVEVSVKAQIRTTGQIGNSLPIR